MTQSRCASSIAMKGVSYRDVKTLWHIETVSLRDCVIQVLCHKDTVSYRYALDLCHIETVSYRDSVIQRLCHVDAVLFRDCVIQRLCHKDTPKWHSETLLCHIEMPLICATLQNLCLKETVSYRHFKFCFIFCVIKRRF